MSNSTQNKFRDFVENPDTKTTQEIADKSEQRYKEVANSTQNDYEVINKLKKAVKDGVFTDSKQDNWDGRFDEQFRSKDGKETWHIQGWKLLPKDIKHFIAKELADARKEVTDEVIEKIMECRKEIAGYQCTADILNKCVTKHEKAWINSGFRLSLESTNKLLAHFLATLKEEGV